MRAKELLARAERLDVSLYSFWSGGIDSTCVLVSLLKNASASQKERIVVLMSEESISENPNFYRDHVHGKLRRDSSTMFPYLLGTKHLFVSGERVMIKLFRVGYRGDSCIRPVRAGA